MKKYSLLILMMAVCRLAWSGTTWPLLGVEYSVDTLFHANIGPGTSQTSLHFTNDSEPNIVFHKDLILQRRQLQTHERCYLIHRSAPKNP